MSGVYIPNMDVPKTCGGCLRVGWNYVFECRIDDVEEDERLSSCPLISIPEHGRLIDADVLPVSTAVPLNGKSYKYVHIDNISIAPTIIPADIKTTYYPQVDGITPTVIKPKKEETE